MATDRRVHMIILVFCGVFLVCQTLAEDAIPYGQKKMSPNFPDNFNQGAKIMQPPDPNLKLNAQVFNGNAHQNLPPPAQPANQRQNPAIPLSVNRMPDARNPPLQSKDPAGGSVPVRPAAVKLADTRECGADVKQFCAQASMTNNFAVLDCLQNDIKSYSDISEVCQHYIWQYKYNLTHDMRFDSAASEVCKESLSNLPDCNRLETGKGLRISCLIENKANVTKPSCRQFLTKMASIIFSDFRLITHFANNCNDDISKLNCGRLHPEGDDSPHSQGKTIECLSENVGKLQDSCKLEILRIAELQADDYHEDRALFYACRGDRERLCARTKAGGGKVYRCLYRHKFEKEMSSDCREKLTTRQRVMQLNYKANFALTEACRGDVRTYHCFKNKSLETRNGKLSTILLCLEDKLKQDKPVSQECLAELREMRRSLMEDFEISPEIVIACEKEIRDECDGMGRNGKTLHCLMDGARKDARLKPAEQSFSKICMRRLEDLLEETDVADDYRMDPYLAEACEPVVEMHCKDIQPGEGRVMACLMELVGTDDIKPDCQERLLELQYFVARDFKLDSRLFKLCKQDAKQKCNAPEQWYSPDDTSPDLGPLIFTCLYRHLKSKISEEQLSRGCSFEVKRVMRQRAISVELEPRIEEPCLNDLAYYCSGKTGPGKEIECLQDNFKDLEPECKSAVGNFTEDEDEDVQLDKILLRACTPMIKKFCRNVMNGDEEDAKNVMVCLIQYKNHADMNRKCAEGVEHHQLVSLNDYRFSYKFKEACKDDILRLCKNRKNKNEVIKCLSEVRRNDTLLEQEQRLDKACRRQLRFELLQRSESISLDPDLKKSCENDVKEYCQNVQPGRSQVIECLKKHEEDLTPPCKKIIFKREVDEAVDASVDYLLMTNCKTMIQLHCRDSRPEDLMQCLHQFKDGLDFDSRCRNIILGRQALQNKNIKLNPVLFKSCKLDIPKFCKSALTSQAEGTEFEGRVMACLKVQFRQKRLSTNCEVHLGEVMREAALDYRQDPKLAAACRNEIQEHCLQDMAGALENDNNEVVEECLKARLVQGKILNPLCVTEVTRILAESRADIQVDPLLHRACALDLKHYCADVPLGEGRQMSCLLSAREDKTVHLTRECSKMLTDRVSMWEYAAKVAPPEDMHEVVGQIMQSKSRNYFLIVILSVLGIIFFGGIFCGRITKRVKVMHKNK